MVPSRARVRSAHGTQRRPSTETGNGLRRRRCAAKLFSGSPACIRCGSPQVHGGARTAAPGIVGRESQPGYKPRLPPAGRLGARATLLDILRWSRDVGRRRLPHVGVRRARPRPYPGRGSLVPFGGRDGVGLLLRKMPCRVKATKTVRRATRKGRVADQPRSTL
jgi:hypothetical protein